MKFCPRTPITTTPVAFGFTVVSIVTVYPSTLETALISVLFLMCPVIVKSLDVEFTLNRVYNKSYGADTLHPM